MLDFSFEKQLIERGNKIVFGVDEVGVGPLAGNVTATAVMLSDKLFPILNLKDSKQLSARRREEFVQMFRGKNDLAYATASIPNKIIDKINIFEARKLVTIRAILKLERKLGVTADTIILDGRTYINIDRKQIAIIKGDEKIASCAIASIIAKVTRDKTMMNCHKTYPQYRFDLHKGYGTKLHFEMIKKYGPSPIHRRSFNLGLVRRGTVNV